MAVWRRCILSAALALLVCATLRKTLVTCQSQAQSTEEDLTQATPSSLAKFLIFIIVVMILIVAGAVCRYRGGTLSDTSAPSLSTFSPTSHPPSSNAPMMPNVSSSITSPPLPPQIHSLTTPNNTDREQASLPPLMSSLAPPMPLRLSEQTATSLPSTTLTPFTLSTEQTSTPPPSTSSPASLTPLSPTDQIATPLTKDKETLDLEKDEKAVQDHLKDLTKEELKSLFRTLGLSPTRVENRYDSSLNVCRDDLVRSWILEDDRVKEKGGATWENLQSALRSIGKTGIADKIPQELPHSPPPASTTNVLPRDQSYTSSPLLSRRSTDSSDFTPAMGREELSFWPSRIELLTEGSPDHLSVYRELVPIAHKWKILGLQLGVPYSTLMAIQADYRDSYENYLYEVLQQWWRSDPNPSWKSLIEVLKSHSVNEWRLANELERSFS